MTKYQKRILHLLSTANKKGLPFHPDIMNYMEEPLAVEKKRFLFLSDAKIYQRKKQREGYKTKLQNFLGISHPYRIVITYFK